LARHRRAGRAWLPYPRRTCRAGLTRRVLYRLVRKHLGEFLHHARDTYDGSLPKYVENEFCKYLDCGDFARGFAHVHCTQCEGSPHAFAVAFRDALRDTRRGTSCAGRRTAGSAAQLVDCVLPAVSARQYVLAFYPSRYYEARPYELSGVVARLLEGGANGLSALGESRRPRGFQRRDRCHHRRA
jgi:hypothetical protein